MGGMKAASNEQSVVWSCKQSAVRTNQTPFLLVPEVNKIALLALPWQLPINWRTYSNILQATLITMTVPMNRAPPKPHTSKPHAPKQRISPPPFRFPFRLFFVPCQHLYARQRLRTCSFPKPTSSPVSFDPFPNLPTHKSFPLSLSLATPLQICVNTAFVYSIRR